MVMVVGIVVVEGVKYSDHSLLQHGTTIFVETCCFIGW